MITRIDGIVLSDKMKEKIKYFQSNGDIYLDKLDEILDNIINGNRDNPQRQVDNICVIREMYRLLKCIAEAEKEANND